MEISEASRTRRATKMDMLARRSAVARLVEHFQPCGVRQMFYQAEVGGLVEKEKSGYDKVQRAIVWLRQEHYMPFGYITDATRWMRKPASFSNIEDALRNTVDCYRRAIWRHASVYVEFWIEKDALAGTLYPVTSEFDVPLMVARGYSSLTFLYSAAEAIIANGKPAYIYHLGDWDPSGQDAADHIERKLREYAPGCEIHFQKLAVTPQQISEWTLPTRPTKRKDSRAKKWTGGDSVELDAIPPDTLRQIVRGAIEQHINQDQVAAIEAAEQSEREIAGLFIDQFNGFQWEAR